MLDILVYKIMVASTRCSICWRCGNSPGLFYCFHSKISSAQPRMWKITQTKLSVLWCFYVAAAVVASVMFIKPLSCNIDGWDFGFSATSYHNLTLLIIISQLWARLLGQTETVHLFMALFTSSNSWLLCLMVLSDHISCLYICKRILFQLFLYVYVWLCTYS